MYAYPDVRSDNEFTLFSLFASLYVSLFLIRSIHLEFFFFFHFKMIVMSWLWRPFIRFIDVVFPYPDGFKDLNYIWFFDSCCSVDFLVIIKLKCSMQLFFFQHIFYFFPLLLFSFSSTWLTCTWLKHMHICKMVRFSMQTKVG